MMNLPLLSEEERRRIVAETKYEWESCVKCGRSEKDFFLENGYSMLLWHPEPGPMCEYCWGDWAKEQDEDEEE
jgi:hypothetical protein